MEVPHTLMVQEPDSFEVHSSIDNPDSGVVIFISDSTVTDKRLGACGIILSANQFIALLDKLKPLEQPMRREIAQRRGGRPMAFVKMLEKDGK